MCSLARRIVTVSLIAAATIAPQLGAIEAPEAHLLFDSGKDGYPRYRIPCLLVTAKKTVLAICEGRKDGRGLTGNIDIVLRRSSDNGRTWGPLEIVADDGPHTLGNPCAVVDRFDGTIWLAFTRSHGADTEPDIVESKSRETTRVFITSSKDDGKTWSRPRELTTDVRRDTWTWYGTGPGTGVQLKSGRLVIPSYHAEAKSKVYRSHVLYSDDHGKTWKAGQAVGEHCSESQAVEMRDGSLFLNARTIQGPQRRTVALSSDGGLTWGKPANVDALYDPSCQAALLGWPKAGPKGQPIWLFTHPAGPGRRELTLRASLDEGKSWPIARLLRTGDSQYSCLAPLADGTIGCLYESWVEKNYRLYFVRLPMPSLAGN